MSDLAIFVVGLLLTVAIGGAMAFLIWAAILDGQAERAREAGIEAGPGQAPAEWPSHASRQTGRAGVGRPLPPPG